MFSWKARAACIARIGLLWMFALAPTAGHACACGCGVFDIGTASMFPHNAGGMVFVEYDVLDQNGNWSGTSRAPAADNADKRIRTSFMNLGVQYEFNRAWGVSVELPYWQRRFQTGDGGTVASFTHGAPGDIRIKGLYTGFSDDMSSGISFGVKLPSGDSSYAHFDPDTELGTGSTDALVGGYHLGNLSADGRYRYFAQAQWDLPVANKAVYRPGAEADATAGAYFEGWDVLPSWKLAPVLQVNASYRGHDGGGRGDPANSGYERLLVTPGVQLNADQFSVYVDVGIPVYVNSSGNQLVAAAFYRLNLSHRF